MRALDGGASLIPLHYAVRALKRQLSQQRAPRSSPELVTRVRKQLSRIAALIDELGLDKGRQITANLDELRTILDDDAPRRRCRPRAGPTRARADSRG